MGPTYVLDPPLEMPCAALIHQSLPRLRRLPLPRCQTPTLWGQVGLRILRKWVRGSLGWVGGGVCVCGCVCFLGGGEGIYQAGACCTPETAPRSARQALSTWACRHKRQGARPGRNWQQEQEREQRPAMHQDPRGAFHLTTPPCWQPPIGRNIPLSSPTHACTPTQAPPLLSKALAAPPLPDAPRPPRLVYPTLPVSAHPPAPRCRSALGAASPASQHPAPPARCSHCDNISQHLRGGGA